LAKNIVAKTWSVPIVGGFWRSKPPEDTLAPTVPVIQSASSTSATSASVTISPLSEDSQSDVREYILKARNNGVGEYTERARVAQPLSGTSVTGTMSGLTPLTTYQVVASSVDNAPARNESADSLPFIFSTPTGVAQFGPTFPRMALVGYGGSAAGQSYPAADRATLGRADIALLAGGWEGWATGRGYTREDVVTGIKAASTAPKGTLVFQYSNLLDFDPVSPHYAGLFNTLNAGNYWLYNDATHGGTNSGTAGTKTPSNYQADNWLVDYLFQGATDAGALYWNALFYGIGALYNAGNAAPSLDGIFLDNMLLNPQVTTGDWTRDGVADVFNGNGNSGLSLLLQQAHKRIVDKWRSIVPSTKYFCGNCGDYGRYGVTVMDQQMNGGMYEAAIGRSISQESFGSYAGLMARYRATYDVTATPNLMIFHCQVTNGTAYKEARYIIATALVGGDGYCGITRTDKGYSAVAADQVAWDEMFGGAKNQRGYLGYPIEGRQSAARFYADSLGGGVWVRYFENGVALAGAKRGNGDQTTPYGAVALTRPCYPLRGVLETTINNAGPAITSVTGLTPRDGRVLMYAPQ
jgi:hypothetical protein